MKVILNIGTASVTWALIQESLQGSRQITYKSLDLELGNQKFSKENFYEKLKIKLIQIRDQLPGIVTGLHCLLPSAFFDWKVEQGQLSPIPFTPLLTDINTILEDCDLEAGFLGSCLNAEVAAIQKFLPEFFGVLVSSNHAETIYTTIEKQKVLSINRTGSLTGNESEPLQEQILPLGSARQYMRLSSPLKNLFETIISELPLTGGILLSGGIFDLSHFSEMLAWRAENHSALLIKQLNETDPLCPALSVYTPIYCHLLVS